MKLSSILMICSGLINTGIAGVFYYFAFTSYLDNWLYGAGWQLIIGVMFTIVSIGSFLGSKRLDQTKSTMPTMVLTMVALLELFFSLPLLFFAFAGGYMSLLDYGIPILLASIFLIVGSVLKWRELRQRRIKNQPKSRS